MTKLELTLIKGLCLRYATDNDMISDFSDNKVFRAQSVDCLIVVEYDYLYEQYQAGWSIEDTLLNESNYREAV